MFNTASGYSLSDVAAVTGNRNDGAFGGDGGAWWIIILFLFVFCGWGNGGWGGNGNNAGLQGALTRGDLCMDMNFNDVQNGVRNVNDAVNTGFANLNATICHQQYDTAMLVNGVNSNIVNGFHGVDNAICNLGYQTQQSFNATQNQIADCCCKTQTNIMQLGNSIERGFCDVNYNMATNTNAIMQSGHNDVDRVLAKLDAMEMSRKDETIANLRTQLAACGDQTTAQYIINQLTNIISPRAVPAYPAASPCGLGNWSAQVLANSWNGNGCGCNNGCGCGSF